MEVRAVKRFSMGRGNFFKNKNIENYTVTRLTLYIYYVD